VAKDKEESAKKAAERKAVIIREIWGIVFLALAVLVLISLVAHFLNRDILGPYLGSALAEGLLFLFGNVPAFFFPGVIGYIGWTRLREDHPNFRNIMLYSGLMIELCILIAVPRLGVLLDLSWREMNDNLVGSAIIKIIGPLFDHHRFGLYYIFGTAFALTALYCLRISPIAAVKALFAGVKQLFAFFTPIFAGKFDRSSTAEKQKNTPAFSIKEPTTRRQVVQLPAEELPFEEPLFQSAEKTFFADGSASSKTEELDPAEAELRRQFDEELAAFRAKKREPIKIMTVETTEVEADDEPEIDTVRFRDKGEPKDMARSRSTIAAVSGALAEAVPAEPVKSYEIPNASILPDPPPVSDTINKEDIEKNSMILEKTLANFGVEGKVVSVSPGPVVTRYEIVLAPGVKINKVVNLHNDISMAVGGQPIRIEAPIPGKSAVGIELPNSQRQIVYFKNILTSETFTKSKAKLPVVVGTNISGAPYVADIFKMPHMLIAGQTGSGKSVCINSIIASLLMTKKPEELRLIMIDPKKVELSFYNGIPHLLSPVVTESKEAVKALHWGVGEMERRYRLLAKVAARNIDSFNSRVESGKLKDTLPDEDNKPLPFIVIIVDELADLMTKSSKDVERLIQRIAQLARAVGIHLIVATQRPSVDIITGPIKANLTSRIAFRTIQSNDSRTILDHIGAEKLLGMGDMLFLRNGAPQIERFHGAFLSEEDVEKIVGVVRKQQVNIEKIESFADVAGGNDDEEFSAGSSPRDEFFEEAAQIIVDTGLGSTSLLQRRLNLGYARAGRIMDQLHDAGIVGPPNGSKAREVIVRPDELDDTLAMLRQP
jgi:DNA segregation ATPase FtsK/SpoIIIE-like protein